MISAQDDVEFISEGKQRLRQFQIEVGNEQFSRMCRARMKNGILAKQGIAREIHLRNQPLSKLMSEEREMNMRGSPSIVVIAPRIGTRFDGIKMIPSLLVCQGSSCSIEIGV